MAARKNTGVMELWIGFSVIAGVLLIAGMILAWGSRGGALDKTYPVLVSMPHVGALRTGAPIQLAGIKIGKVGDIKLNEDATAVDITCNVDYKIRLPVDSSAHVATMGIVGDSFLEIVRGQSKELIPQLDEPDGEKSRLKGTSAGDLAEVMKTVTEVGDNINLLVTNVNDILGDNDVRRSLKASIINVNEITVNTNKLLTDLQRVVARVNTSVEHINTMSETLEGSIQKTSDNLVDAGDRVRKTIDTVLSDENIAIVNGSVAALRQTIDNLQRGTEHANRLLAAIPPEKVTQVVDNLDATIAKAGALADKGGKLVDGLDVDAVNRGINDAGKTLERVNFIISKIEPEDVAAAVRNLKIALGDVQVFIAGVKKDIVFALAANQAATRIVDKKFKELGRDGITTADGQGKAVSEWLNEALLRGYVPDPNYPDPSKAPYNRNVPTGRPVSAP